MSHPRWGHTKTGLPVHKFAWDHHAVDTAYQKFNKNIAVKITNSVGSMTCAWIFCIIALISFPAAILSGSVIIIVAWVAQTFLQLVLLSVIMVGQNVQQAASDARANKQFEDTETIVDRLDLNTQGGIAVLHSQLKKISDNLGISHEDA